MRAPSGNMAPVLSGPPPPDDRRALPIGVFDSGVGGLTVLHELLVSLPREDFLYLGDSARLPYGTRAPHELRAFAVEIGEELLARGAKLLVVACNSATATALEHLRRHVASTGREIDVIGVVGPESNLAVAATRSGRIGLLATPATVASGAYERAVQGTDALTRLTSVACPDLAEIIEADTPVTQRVVETVRGYCAPIIEARVDTVILGCTHYPLVRPMLQRILGPDVRLITSGAAMVRRVQHALSVRDLVTTRAGEGCYGFLTTGDASRFRATGTRFLQLPIQEVEHVDLTTRAAA